jgi:hypothetical protein
LKAHGSEGENDSDIAIKDEMQKIVIEFPGYGYRRVKGDPYDNAFAESFMKTLKYEEVYLNEYGGFNDALHNIEHFI